MILQPFKKNFAEEFLSRKKKILPRGQVKN